MPRFAAARLLGAALCGLAALLPAGCGTLDNEIRIAYQSPAHTVATLTLRSSGPVSDTVLGGELRNHLSRSGWSVTSDDGGAGGPATLTATYEADNGKPFPEPGAPPRGGAPVPDLTQTLFQRVEAQAEDGVFVRRLTVKFTTAPGAFALPPAGDPIVQQFLESLLQAAALVPAPPGGRGAPNPINERNFDRASFDKMMDAVVRLRVTVNVPGAVKETNAGRVRGGEATWDLGAGALRQSKEYYVIGEEMLWGKAAGAAASVTFIGGAFGLLGMYLAGGRRRPAAPAAAALPQQASEGEAVRLRLISEELPPAEPPGGGSGSAAPPAGRPGESGPDG